MFTNFMFKHVFNTIDLNTFFTFRAFGRTDKKFYNGYSQPRLVIVVNTTGDGQNDFMIFLLLHEIIRKLFIGATREAWSRN